MSEVFEGILLKGNFVDHDALAIDGAARIEKLGDVTVVYRDVPRAGSGFSSDTDLLAQRLADRLGSALVVRYDSRLGHRSSTVFRPDRESARFDLEDELFVPLDDEGEPRSDVEPIAFNERRAEEEYETSSNAIERGLAELGASLRWPELRRFIASR